MTDLSSLSNAELAQRLSGRVRAERHAIVDVIEHLVEVERRHLYLTSRITSLFGYCMKELGYDEDATLKRHRVAKLALRFPQVLDELRAGTMHLTGLFVLAGLEPLSPSRWRVEFTARVELYEKVEKARELLSHALPTGDLGELFERALDALIEQESRRRFGAGKPRKTREFKPGSRHVPVAIQRAVWERDGSQCTFVDDEGHRCADRRFLTLEHRTPFALGGPPTLENLCLLCSAHNLASARQVFGAAYIESKIREKTRTERSLSTETQPESKSSLEAPGQVLSSPCGLGFGRSEVSAAIGHALGSGPGLGRRAALAEMLALVGAEGGLSQHRSSLGLYPSPWRRLPLRPLRAGDHLYRTTSR